MIIVPELRRPVHVAACVSCAFVAAAVLGPILWLIQEALGQGEGLAVPSGSLVFRVSLTTVAVSSIVATCCVILAFPVSYLALHTAGRTKSILLSLCLSSMLVSLLIRTFAWTVILSRNGLIAYLVQWVGISGDTLLHSRVAVIVGMTHILIPFAVAAIVLSCRSVHYQRMSSAALGGTWIAYLVLVFFREAKPGVLIGWCLVFVLGLGFYITPELLGGGKGDSMMLGNLISEKVFVFGDWQAASVTSLCLLAIVFVSMFVAANLPSCRRWLRESAINEQG